MLSDISKYVIKNIGQRLTRSTLTILSIMIGIMAIYALLSFGQGLNVYINDFGQQMGTDKLIMQPRGAGAPGSTGTFILQDDLDFIKKQRGVSEVTAMGFIQAEVKEKDDKRGKWVFINGIPTGTKEQELIESMFGGIGIGKGRQLKKGDNNKVVLGYNYQLAEVIFNKPLKVGKKIFMHNHSFEIIGFYEEIGNPQDDSNVYLTQESYNKLFDFEGKYSVVYLKAEKGTNPSKLADYLENKLRRHKGLKEGQEDFYIQTFEELLETFGQILTVMNVILFLIAFISVVVAAVNITNTMYTAVLERTKEIGIMKAIGARNSYILWIFFLESGALGLIGGVLGIGLGYALAKGAGAAVASAGYSFLAPAFPWWLTMGCLAFAFIVGAGSGFIPALQASRHKPVDALRYE